MKLGEVTVVPQPMSNMVDLHNQPLKYGILIWGDIDAYKTYTLHKLWKYLKLFLSLKGFS